MLHANQLELGAAAVRLCREEKLGVLQRLAQTGGSDDFKIEIETGTVAATVSSFLGRVELRNNTRVDRTEFDRLLGLLMPKNQEWAKHAGALGISFAKKTFSHAPQPNRFGVHDVGSAFAQLSLQAVEMGLHVHGMGGFDAARTRTEFAIPDDFEVGAAFAIGYLDGDGAPPEGRKRKPLHEIVFTGEWNKPATL